MSWAEDALWRLRQDGRELERYVEEFIELSHQKTGKLQALSNSKHISGAFGMSGHPPLPFYLHIFISKCPIGDASSLSGSVLYYSWKNLTNCRDLSFAVGGRVSWGA
ncbi:proline-rich receptor kinase PERK2 [Labeo rohita]|uniref:Proline-rich receptor kinase PERK2 n=1 Tax=Labeo rohita TaxID=84645 RepID=A0A498MSS4_LABRO|nr:proline-rich receptor kinase PERK2 [Labeo rohita]